MKQRFGALLCIMLGVVLIVGGVSAGPSGIVGSNVPTCVPGPGVVVPQCPTGTIAFSETTTGAGATPPSGGWLVDITSPNCTDPSGDTVAMTVTVPNGGNATSDALLIFTDPDHTTSCSYVLTEQDVPNTVATFDPASPETIEFTNNDQSSSNRAVALTNTYTAPTSTTTSTTSAAPSSSTAAPISASESAPVSVSELPTAGSAGAAAGGSTASESASTAPVLATTGTSTPTTATTIVGIALCLFGLVLLFAGRRRPRASRHT